ncbi:DMT family transporter [Leptolyngbya sp. FACHB-36]|uniref:DMT family transporter n=1 Tax=Leptolyngbya sp. FACHB-36 TaxID=2692808 RepID=UPI0016802B88|nr:DMT family transporter [Leptolyngbya sp. FACHB-36]MBD2022145.1 DMT family transporter [Leptolyngbya sp. FACHB-36]
MSSLNQPKEWQIALILSGGVLAIATSAVLVRLSMQATGASGPGFSLVLAASRLTLAAIVLLPNWHRQTPSPTALRYALTAGVALAIHFATWITSLSYTTIAASTTIVTTNPVWIAVLSWVWYGEKPSPQTGLGISIALAGGLVIGLGGAGTSPDAAPLLGNSLALVGAWAASLYFLLGREAQQQGLSISGYATIAYSTAAIVLLPLPLLVGTSYTGYPLETYGYIALMALLPQLIGHTSLNWAVRWVSPTLVALVVLFEPVASSLFGYVLFDELPGLPVLGGGLLLLIGVAIAAVSRR